MDLSLGNPVGSFLSGSGHPGFGSQSASSGSLLGNIGKSVGNVLSGNIPTPYGDTNRGLFASWFNGKNIAKEDFIRQMQQMEYGNKFEADEAQKQRDWSSSEAERQRAYDERMVKDYYKNMIEGMKVAGINPIMAFQNGVSQMPSAHGSIASGGSSARSHGSSYKGFVSDTSGFLGFITSLASIFAGLYNTGASNATKMSVAKTYASGRKPININFNNKKK